jgi:hypothetical protein
MQTPLIQLFVAIGLSGVIALSATAQNWPSFRGPFARGVSDRQNLPADWDVKTGRNIRWKTAIPGQGHSSPVVWGEKLFVTSVVRENPPALKLGDSGIGMADDRVPHTWRVSALSTQDGRLLWSKDVHSGVPRATRHVKSSQANSTPVTDGRVVVAVLGSEGLVAFDLQGTLKWRADLGVLNRASTAIPPPSGVTPVRRSSSRIASSFRWTATRTRIWRPSISPPQTRVECPPGRTTGVEHAHPAYRGRAHRPDRGGRRIRPRPRSAHRRRGVEIQGRGGGEDSDAVRGRRPHCLLRRIPRPTNLRFEDRGQRRHLGACQREDGRFPRLAHRGGRTVHRNPTRLRRPAVCHPRRGHLRCVRPEDRRAPLSRTDEHHPQRVSGGERWAPLSRGRGRRGDRAQGRDALSRCCRATTWANR